MIRVKAPRSANTVGLSVGRSKDLFSVFGLSSAYKKGSTVCIVHQSFLCLKLSKCTHVRYCGDSFDLSGRRISVSTWIIDALGAVAAAALLLLQSVSRSRQKKIILFTRKTLNKSFANGCEIFLPATRLKLFVYSLRFYLQNRSTSDILVLIVMDTYFNLKVCQLYKCIQCSHTMYLGLEART